MKTEFGYRQYKELVATKTVCDECGNEAFGTVAQVQLKFSFNEKPEVVKDLFWVCAFKLYPRDHAREREEKEFAARTKAYIETKGVD